MEEPRSIEELTKEFSAGKPCPDCGQLLVSIGWCRSCETAVIKDSFRSWSSGNSAIDDLIQHTKLSATMMGDLLEWIPFEKLELVYRAYKGSYSSIYSAIWPERPRKSLDLLLKQWSRQGPTKVALKSLDYSWNISPSFVDQMKNYSKCLTSACMAEIYGITRDPSNSYVVVMKYFEGGNLYQFLESSNQKISWPKILDMLWGITEGLLEIHKNGKLHRNIHRGNILIDSELYDDARLSDVGMYGPCNETIRHDIPLDTRHVYGVLPFVAPEVLRGGEFTSAADIYSFGIVMSVFATEWVSLTDSNAEQTDFLTETLMADRERRKVLSIQSQIEHKPHYDTYYNSRLLNDIVACIRN
ncbi:unnamed protein product [Rhizophagus irregularis]|uniref:Protein kinase domain-containing protein n=1 Tax=Rhizophagus irregularis TaxID=588596 RepID=A0A915ZNI4_9GLOM|nr:unnamed protein product [Rhizophagus irregularis]